MWPPLFGHFLWARLSGALVSRHLLSSQDRIPAPVVGCHQKQGHGTVTADHFEFDLDVELISITFAVRSDQGFGDPVDIDELTGSPNP